MEGKEEVKAVPATVAMPEVGTEEPVIGKERWEEIRRMRAEGLAVSRIAREPQSIERRIRFSVSLFTSCH